MEDAAVFLDFMDMIAVDVSSHFPPLCYNLRIHCASAGSYLQQCSTHSLLF